MCYHCKANVDTLTLSYNLHLAVVIRDDPRVQRTAGLCRKLVSTFSHSWKKKRKAQLDLGLPQHSLATDCVTRWGSQFKITSRVLEQEASIRQVQSPDCKSGHLIPTWQDLDVLESMQAALGQLEDFTDMLSGEKKVTVSVIKVVLHILKTKVLKVTLILLKVLKVKYWVIYRASMMLTLMNYWVCVPTYLDPRFKESYIEGNSAIVKDRLASEGVEIIDEKM